MVTWWSRLHGEPYLRRRRGYGEVEDMEGLTVVLWFRGIRQWRSHGLLGHRACMEEDDREGNGERKRE